MNGMAVGALVLVVLIVGWIVMRRLHAKRRVQANSIEAEELFALLETNEILLYDVRQPLDFLAYPEIIPGAMRIAPKNIAEETASFPRDHNAVIYCTGADDATSLMVLGKARALNFTRVKMLRGGLSAWKAKGYPVEAYTESFQLDTRN
jgi:rhodanese-related sulfurtransferase